jgi:hypothetical protein
MLEVYHSASELSIWLGANSEGGRRVFNFISRLTRSFEEVDDFVGTEDNKGSEILFEICAKPIGALARGCFRIAHGVDQIWDLKYPAGLDSKAEILIDPDGGNSLHCVESGNPRFQPSAQRLAKVTDEGDFFHIADILSRIFIQNDWFSRMW